MIQQYHLENEHIRFTLLNLGSTIYSIQYKHQGQWQECTVQYKNIEEYRLDNPYYLNAFIGPHAGRVKDASYTFQGENVQLERNDQNNHLHGGSDGLHTQYFTVHKINKKSLQSKLHHRDVDYQITYTLQDREIMIDIQAHPHKTSLLNLTQHSYFNLSNEKSIQNHALQIPSQYVQKLDQSGVPSRELFSSQDTVFDFNQKRKIKTSLNGKHPQFDISRNIDHPFKMDDYPITLWAPDDSFKLEVRSSSPYTVIYLSNFFENQKEFLKRGLANNHEAIAIEPSYLPNNVNIQKDSNIYTKDSPYKQWISYRFD